MDDLQRLFACCDNDSTSVRRSYATLFSLARSSCGLCSLRGGPLSPKSRDMEAFPELLVGPVRDQNPGAGSAPSETIVPLCTRRGCASLSRRSPDMKAKYTNGLTHSFRFYPQRLATTTRSFLQVEIILVRLKYRSCAVTGTRDETNTFRPLCSLV